MPSINLITTTAGRAAILAAVAGSTVRVVTDAQLSDTDQGVGVGTTSLSNVVATLAATGEIRTVGGVSSMHVVVSDDSSAAYEVRALSLRLDDGTFLMVYSQSGVIAAKAASSSLHLAIDLTVDADTAATIEFGDTDFALPSASEEVPGVIELATEAEADAANTLMAVTPFILKRIYDRVRHYMAVANWTRRTPASSYAGNFYAVTYGEGLFVAVGSGGEIQTSPDGTTWTHRTPAASFSGDFRGIAYGGGAFVAVGTGGEIQTSPDGITWSQQSPDASYVGDFYAVAYKTGLFVAVGSGGEIQTASTIATWTRRTPAGGYNDDFRAVAYDASLDMFAAVGGDSAFVTGEIQTSPDGITWTRRGGSPFPDFTIHAVCSVDGGFVASGTSGRVWTSEDGISWSVVTSGSTSTTSDGIANGDGCVVACGSNVARFWVISPDGLKEDVPGSSGTGAVTETNAICFHDGRFLTVGNSGLIAESLYV